MQISRDRSLLHVHGVASDRIYKYLSIAKIWRQKISFLATIANVLSRDLFAKSVPKCKYYKSKIFELFINILWIISTLSMLKQICCAWTPPLWMHHKISYWMELKFLIWAKAVRCKSELIGWLNWYDGWWYLIALFVKKITTDSKLKLQT